MRSFVLSNCFYNAEQCFCKQKLISSYFNESFLHPHHILCYVIPISTSIKQQWMTLIMSTACLWVYSKSSKLPSTALKHSTWSITHSGTWIMLFMWGLNNNWIQLYLCTWERVKRLAILVPTSVGILNGIWLKVWNKVCG